MINALSQMIRKLTRNLSGNAAMLVALGMPVLIGGTGLAVDTAQWFLWKREMQHAVDQAAVSGAWALSNSVQNGQSYDNQNFYAYRAKQEYKANLAITRNFASDAAVSLANYNGGSDNSIVVAASASKKLPFSGFITNSAVVINVHAQASYQKGATYTACLTALAKSGTDTIDIGGNATVKADCGLAALSCADNAVQIDSSATVETGSIVTCGTASVPTSLDGVVTEKVSGLYDVYKDLTPPDNPAPQKVNCSKGSNKQASLSPGTYSGGLVIKCTTVMAKGIYVIDGGVLDLSANYDVTGTNVLFVLKNGATVKFGGSGNNNKITLSPPVASDFDNTPYASEADKLAGMLVFETRDNNPGSPGHILNGNSNSLIEGLMYMPSGGITVNGTANVASQCLRISAATITISGNANLETLCPTKDSTVVGTAAADVRLVA